jgi:hypothetical protein
MNRTRIVIGGVVAGVIINLFEFGVEPLMGTAMEDWLHSLGLTPPTETAMLGMAGLSFATGLSAVWLYAALRPRFGAGLRTALLTSVVMWVLTCMIPNFALAALGILTGRLLWLSTWVPMIEMALATVAGAWVYREGETRRAAEPARA